MAKRKRRDQPAKRPLSPEEDRVVLAGVVARFAHAVAKLRSYGSRADFSEEMRLGDDNPDDGGLAASRVLKRPPDRSGSGSAAIREPTDDPDPIGPAQS
jgi:hypothetical protein